MKLSFLVIVGLFSFEGYTQKVSYTDLLALERNHPDKYAEKLFEKGFGLRHASNNLYEYKDFEIVSDGKSSISIEYFGYKDGSFEYKSCFYGNYNKDYSVLLSQIKSKATKLRFFFDEGYDVYMTEYKLGNSYLYVFKGMCYDESLTVKQNAFIISSKKIM